MWFNSYWPGESVVFRSTKHAYLLFIIVRVFIDRPWCYSAGRSASAHSYVYRRPSLLPLQLQSQSASVRRARISLIFDTWNRCCLFNAVIRLKDLRRRVLILNVNLHLTGCHFKTIENFTFEQLYTRNVHTHTLDSRFICVVIYQKLES